MFIRYKCYINVIVG